MRLPDRDPTIPSGGPRLLGLPGSLRRQSFNRWLLDAAADVASDSVRLQVHAGVGDVPLFNEDLEAEGEPPGVARLRAAIGASDALVIATPEYNQALPGVAKNLVDWLSRGAPPVLAGKPVGILGASVGPWGTRLAQAGLRQTLTACGALVMPAPQVYVRDAGALFDAEGALTDPRTREQLGRYMAALADWVALVAPQAARAAA
jgi:chromate reductase